MADAALGVLLQKLVTLIQDEAQHVHEFPIQLNKMKEELQLMQSYLHDVDNVNKDQKKIVKTINQKMRELLYDAEDIIVDCELMFVRQQRQRASNCVMCCSLSFFKFRYQMGKKLRAINEDIKSHRERMIPYLGTIPTPLNQERSQLIRYPALIKEDEIVGVNADWNKIRKWLLEIEGPLTVIGIAGMGGIGKTTLAQKVYNNDDVKRHFNNQLFFAVISQNVELKEIIKDMLRKLGMNENLLTRNELELFQLLRDQLVGKYLLILDDVWTTSEGEWWEKLKSALPERDGSCVIATTRKEDVARSMGATKRHIHHPKILSTDDSWSLFSKIAFASQGGQCSNPELERIGKEIVAWCSGLPLAIKVVSGMMLGKDPSPIQWKKTSDHLKDELAVNNRDELVYSTLRLSYEDLPIHLKPCMLCFAAFPEDSDIFFHQVIDWWIGEGFVRGRNGKTAFETGEECWTELISRGLLLGLVMNEFENFFTYCRVHDMVRDMIVEIAKEEKFMSLDDKGYPSLTIQSRRVCIMKTTIDGLFLSEDDSNLLRLRTLFWRNSEGSRFFPKLYQLKWLRVLVVVNDDDHEEKDEWWNEIGSFPHLIYLQIDNSRLDRLPDSIENLQKLQVLCLYGLRNLKRLPVHITNLEKLINLDIDDCDSLEYYPVGIGKLSNLQHLAMFKPSSCRVGEGCRMSELRKLTQIKLLRIGIYSEDQIGDEELHILSQMKQLKTLKIYFEQRSSNDEEGKQYLRKVDYDLSSPCHQLEELHIWKFPGERTPAWLNPTTLPNLRVLVINGENMTNMHPGFFGNSQGEKWKLEALCLIWCEKLEEEWPRMESAMPFLRLLKVSMCPKLKLFPCGVEGYESIWRKKD